MAKIETNKIMWAWACLICWQKQRQNRLRAATRLKYFFFIQNYLTFRRLQNIAKKGTKIKIAIPPWTRTAHWQLMYDILLFEYVFQLSIVGVKHCSIWWWWRKFDAKSGKSGRSGQLNYIVYSVPYIRNERIKNELKTTYLWTSNLYSRKT